MGTTLEVACGRLRDGSKFGDVYPDFAPGASPEDVAALKYPFVCDSCGTSGGCA